MCRKCYINPVVIDAFLAGELRENVLRGGDGRVRLLQILTRTPAGTVFTSAARKGPRKAAGKKGMPSRVH
jgi:hypothetical protein